MSTARERLLSEARIVLGRQIQEATGFDAADQSFATWLLGAGSPFDTQTFIASCVESPTRSYREVAALGYAAEATVPVCTFRQELCKGLAWISQRPMTICGPVAAFVSDPVALLGIALGAASCGEQTVEQSVRVWMANVLSTRTSLPELETWERCLVAAICHKLRLPGVITVSASADTADCRLILRARGALPPSHFPEMNVDEASLVSLLLADPPEELNFARTVLRAAAFDFFKMATIAGGSVGPRRYAQVESAGCSSGKKVFVSYAWEENDPQHQQRVLDFTNALRTHGGFNAMMDLFVPNPPEGLPQWMMNQIKNSDFVLMVLTENYRRRCEGEEKRGVGKGVKWEGGIVTRALYEAEFQNRKFIPVGFVSHRDAPVPTILVGNTYYNVAKPEGMEELVRYMTDQPAYVPAAIGRTPILPPRPSATETT